MSKAKKEAINKECNRACESLKAAKILFEEKLFRDCLSRAYFAVLHATKAALISEDIETETHAGIRRMFSLHLVKSGKIEKDFARILVAEKEDREIGDYSIKIKVKEERARKRVEEAEKFLKRIEEYIDFDVKS